MTTASIVAIDQGTSATKAIAVDENGSILARARCPLTQQFPRPGWVEQDPDAVWQSAVRAFAELARSRPADSIRGIALSTQRESVVTWDARTGGPLAPVLSWQDSRGAAWCQSLAASDKAGLVQHRTGLPVDPMFSAAKLRWLLERHTAVREAAQAGSLRAGTVDAWLLWHLTGGAHLCEIGNAARTQLFSLEHCAWDSDLLDIVGVPRSTLPDIRPSTGPFGVTRAVPSVPDGTPIMAVLGDSHAALFAHGGFRCGVVKATFGTGSSVMAANPPDGDLPAGLARTIAWQIAASRPTFALEGNVVAAGTAVRWVADLLGCEEATLTRLADNADDSDVVLVPAFNGLGAPYWDPAARAVLVGMTQATGAAQLARAAVESVAFQVADTFALIDTALGGTRHLRADGGASTSNMLMRFLADLVNRPVLRAVNSEASAVGAAYLAGLAAGQWTEDDIESLAGNAQEFLPKASAEWRARNFGRWHDALARARLTSGQY